jgi:hypothetical protein
VPEAALKPPEAAHHLGGNLFILSRAELLAVEAPRLAMRPCPAVMSCNQMEDEVALGVATQLLAFFSLQEGAEFMAIATQCFPVQVLLGFGNGIAEVSVPGVALPDFALLT